MSRWIRRAISVTAVAAASLATFVAVTPPATAATVDCSALSSPVYKTVNPYWGDQLLTRSLSESQNSTTRYGFTEQHGILGYASATPGNGLTPITRMFSAKAVDFLWASSDSQIAAAKLWGYKVQKIDFYAPTSPTACTGTAAVHKYAKTIHRRNAWEATDQKTLLSQGWSDSGTVFYLKTSATATSTAANSPAPTPTPTPTPTTTATGSTSSVASATSPYGVPSGTPLRVVTGDLTITQDGYVLDGVDLYGYVSVKANNVTIKNSIIRGGATATSDRALIMDWNGGTNLVVKDTTLVPQHRSIWLDGISGKNFTAERLDVSGVVDAVKVLGSGVTIRDSFLHDAYYQGSGVSYQSDGQTHNDAVQIEGGGNIALTGNTMTGFHNAAVMITQNSSTITGVTLQNNTLAGGGCTINLSEKGKGAMTGVKMLTNKFGTNRDSSTSCPIIMPPATLAIAQVSGNTWLDNGTTVNARQGT